jgi:hypothetical protein
MIVWTINITYGPNEETDMCAICQSQLNTRFALGKFECGNCKNKFHWICLVGWAKKPESSKVSVMFLMFWFIISQIKTHTCYQCKWWGGMIQRRKHGE